jgi:hypothetical protein
MLTDPRAAHATSGDVDVLSRSTETGMSDFAARVGESVQEARGFSRQPRETPGHRMEGRARPLR